MLHCPPALPSREAMEEAREDEGRRCKVAGGMAADRAGKEMVQEGLEEGW